VGVLVFGAGGMADMLWHDLFGVEQSLEALDSPSHLTLAGGAALIMSGPFRAAWQRRDRAATPAWGQLLPMLLSLTLSGFTCSAQVRHPLLPLRRMMALPDAPEMSGSLHSRLIASLLSHMRLTMGGVRLAMRRWRLPPGSLTLVFTLNGLLMCTLDPANDYGVMAPVMLTGLVADGVRSRLPPMPERPWAFRLVACVMPVVFDLGYFEALRLMNGGWWSVHWWTGAMVLAGLVGWLRSSLILPPQEPQTAHDR
jgi:hypothetical protein